MAETNLPYDPTDKTSIVTYAKRLVGKSLRQTTDIGHIESPQTRRGSYGNAIEEHYFKYQPNSESAPDFAEVGLELKVTPMKKAKGGLVAKERLVISMIDFDEVVNEDFEHSHFLKKASGILLISYLWEQDQDPLDYTVQLVEEWKIPEQDLAQIKQDWETVVGKVRLGRAHEISGSDTMYLEACTKAANSTVRRHQPYSDEPAKPRAWAFKASYMTAVEGDLFARTESIERNESERNLALLDLVRSRFSKFFGLSETELSDMFELTKSKNLCARITRNILGVSEDARIEEFEKAGIKPKTMRLRANGKPKEALSFPTFDYYTLDTCDFEDSEFYEQLQQKYLFVLFREDDSGVYRLWDVCFWQMPESDYPEAKRCYDQMRANVKAGHAEISVRSRENRCCHVRPHARDASDVISQPHGNPTVKKCFWLNQTYLQEEIAKTLESK